MLKDSEIVNLYVGPNNNNCYLVQASLLKSNSPGLHRQIEAFKADYRGKPVTLHFYNDDPKVWETLLYWIIHHKLPRDLTSYEIDDDSIRTNFTNFDADNLPLLHAWLLGERTGIEEFQDTIMLELLRNHKLRPISLDLTTKIFALAPEKSVMRKFLAEHVVRLLKGVTINRDFYRIRPSDLGEMAKIPGAMEAVVAAQEMYAGFGADMFNRIPGDGEGWQSLMVAEGPKQHWVYEQ